MIPVVTLSFTTKAEAQSFSCAPVPLVNASFETYDASLAQPPSPFGTAPNRSFQFVETDVLGWETDATDNRIEIWESGHNGGDPAPTPSFHGGSHGEIAANISTAALTNELPAWVNPGDTVEWAIYHRGRRGVDVAEVRVGSPSGPSTLLQTMSTDRFAWQLYQGSFVVAPGQTRFEFVGITNAGPAGAGNFIDHFQIAVCPAAPTEADLSIEKTVNDQFPNIGTTVTYTVTVTNSGPDAADGVQVLDLLPSGLSYITDNGGMDYDSVSGLWTLPTSLAAGASASLQISASVNPTGNFTNIAEVATSVAVDPDSTPSNSGTAPSEDDTASATITPDMTPPSCPAGKVPTSNQIGYADTVTVDTSVANEFRALGAFSPAGTAPPDASSAEMNFGTDSLVVRLAEAVPQGSLLTFSVGRDGGTAGNATRIEILFSVDGNTFTSAGVYGAAPADYLSAAQDVLEHITVVSPVAGAEFVAFDTLNNDDAFIDGVRFNQTCTDAIVLSAVKTISVIASAGVGTAECSTLPVPATNDQYALPGACVEYRISVTHPGGNPASNIQISDSLPSNLTYAGSNTTVFTGGTIRTTDAASDTITCTSATPDCVVRLEDASLNAGQTGELIIRALIE